MIFNIRTNEECETHALNTMRWKTKYAAKGVIRQHSELNGMCACYLLNGSFLGALLFDQRWNQRATIITHVCRIDWVVSKVSICASIWPSQRHHHQLIEIAHINRSFANKNDENWNVWILKWQMNSDQFIKTTKNIFAGPAINVIISNENDAIEVK